VFQLHYKHKQEDRYILDDVLDLMLNQDQIIELLIILKKIKYILSRENFYERLFFVPIKAGFRIRSTGGASADW